jgi:hypothetical protein
MPVEKDEGDVQQAATAKLSKIKIRELLYENAKTGVKYCCSQNSQLLACLS